MEKYVNLKVLGITFSQIQSGGYALVLGEEAGTKRIPIIIGTSEAQSIAIKLEQLSPPRPLTHDLFISFVNAFGIKIQEVFIYKFEEGVFSSELVCVTPEGVEKRIDSRTSDAIALALRSKARIYTTEDIVARAGVEFEDESFKEAANEEHKGKRSKSKLEELHDQLNLAVKKEDYEAASKLRDEIKQLEGFSGTAAAAGGEVPPSN